MSDNEEAETIKAMIRGYGEAITFSTEIRERFVCTPWQPMRVAIEPGGAHTDRQSQWRHPDAIGRRASRAEYTDSKGFDLRYTLSCPNCNLMVIRVRGL